MTLPHLYELGKLVVMELNFPTLPDDEIAIGQWIILWNEIPIRKIGSNIYEVYPYARPSMIETFEERVKRLAEMLDDAMKFQSRDFKACPDFIKVGQNLINEGTKYMRKRGGSVRVHPWESPKYFG